MTRKIIDVAEHESLAVVKRWVKANYPDQEVGYELTDEGFNRAIVYNTRKL